MTNVPDLLTSAADRIGVARADLEVVAGAQEVRRALAGDRLFQEATPREWFGYVVDGEVELLRGLHGAARVVGRIGPGALLGEGLLVDPDDPHWASARARRDTTVMVFRRADLLASREEQPEVYYRLVAAAALHIQRRLHATVEQLVDPAHAPRLVTGSRLERDSLGARHVPLDAYYGAQTSRAVDNFPLSGIPLSHFSHLVEAMAMVKKAAALANADLGVLTAEKCAAIVAACDEILAGKLGDQFVVDMFQGGAGTSTNMNANEVIANRALELMGHHRGDHAHLHPNDDVNRSQSTNDVYPTAVKIAVILAARETAAALRELRGALSAKATEFAPVLKMGRTEMQDAVPMTLGQEFGAYAVMMGEAAEHIDRGAAELCAVNLGATAIGTGLNSPPGYADLATATLARVSGLPLTRSPDLVEATQDSGEFVAMSASMKRAAVQMSKICNDLRLLSSGPRAGFNEIRLPAVQPGSSIMPGKVNPVIPEAVNQVCFQIIGYDIAVSMAAEASQLELNMAEPLIAYDLLHGLMLLKNATITLATRCIAGIEANVEVCLGYVERSIGLATALNPYIGYDRAVAIAHEALASGRGVLELVREKGWLADEELDAILSPGAMTHPRAAL